MMQFSPCLPITTLKPITSITLRTSTCDTPRVPHLTRTIANTHLLSIVSNLRDIWTQRSSLTKHLTLLPYPDLACLTNIYKVTIKPPRPRI